MDWSSLRRPDSTDKLVADQPPLLEYGAVQAMFVCCLLFQSIYVAHIPRPSFVLGWGISVRVHAGGEKKQQRTEVKKVSLVEENRCSLQKLICPL